MKKIRIAIVDDDEDFAESMADIFELKGHVCELFSNGEKAICRIQEQHFDIIFMDVKLPGKNGVECFLDIQAIKPHSKVVMMTGFRVENLLDQAVRNGAWEVLRKPLDIDHIMRLINKIPVAKILVADDDQDFVNNLEEILEEAGFAVLKANNGEEVLKQIQEDDVDILILDLRMPALNGLDTFLALHNKGCTIPTFIVTAFAKEEAEALEILKSHCVNGILTKPFDPEYLLDTIQDLAGEIKRG